MLPRHLSARLRHLLRHSPAVVLLGPRQAGKTTLALAIAERQPSVYLDLEDEDTPTDWEAKTEIRLNGGRQWLPPSGVK